MYTKKYINLVDEDRLCQNVSRKIIIAERLLSYVILLLLTVNIVMLGI